MIDNDKLIMINRCQSTLCRRVHVLMPGARFMIDIAETGSETCEHVYDPARVVTVRRDVLVLHGLWTAGRHAVSVGMDPAAHILADSLGYEHGDAIPVTDIPLQLVRVSERELSWQGMATAFRVAQAVRDAWHVPAGHVDRWSRITEYLGRWRHHVL